MANRITQDKFEPREWLLEEFGSQFWRREWIRKDTPAKKPEIKKTILQKIISALLLAGLLSRRDSDIAIAEVLSGYSKRAKELEKQGVQAYRREAINDEVLLKSRVRDMLVWSVGTAIANQNKGRRFLWLHTTAQNPDPYHLTLVGKEYPYNFRDKDGYNLFSDRRYGCQCGFQFL